MPHWIDELARPLPADADKALRAYPDLHTAWARCPHGPWLLRVGLGAAHDPDVAGAVREIAAGLVSELANELDRAYAGKDAAQNDPVALAYDQVIRELAPIATGDEAPAPQHRAKARPLETFDEKLRELHKKCAEATRGVMPNPPR
jgi:hypothetical protein